MIRLRPAALYGFISNERNYLGIYIGAFCGAYAISSAFTALPFAIKYFGGSDTAAGGTVSAFHLMYLLACIAIALFIDRLRPKMAVIISLVVQAAICSMLWLSIRHNDVVKFDFVSVIILLTGLWGIALVFLWPPLMGWLSIGHEGKALNRKLGIYNTSWSSGATIGPLIGGYLTSLDIKLPLVAASVMFTIAAIAVSSSKKPQRYQLVGDIEFSLPKTDPLLAKFRTTARITLFTAFICLGLSRAPLGILMRYELPFTEAHFGTALAIIALTSTVSFFLLGKFQNWHYKPVPMLMGQAALIAALIMILTTDTLAGIYAASSIVGITTAFFYASHMFYGVSATTKRSGAMTVHEIILSAGIGLGALGGGYLSDQFGRRLAPYLFGLAIVAIGLAAQATMTLFRQKRIGP